jgi:hypothetical protein
MLFLLLFSIKLAVENYAVENSYKVFIPSVIVAVWLISPTVFKCIGLYEDDFCFPGIIISLVYWFSYNWGLGLSLSLFVLSLIEIVISIIMYIGYSKTIYELFEAIYNIRKNVMIERARKKINHKLEAYEKIINVLSKAKDCQREDFIIELLERCSNQSIKEKYIEKSNERNKELIEQAEIINNKYCLGENLLDKTVSQIITDIDEKLHNLYNCDENLKKYSINELKRLDS